MLLRNKWQAFFSPRILVAQDSMKILGDSFFRPAFYEILGDFFFSPLFLWKSWATSFFVQDKIVGNPGSWPTRILWNPGRLAKKSWATFYDIKCWGFWNIWFWAKIVFEKKLCRFFCFWQILCKQYFELLHRFLEWDSVIYNIGV